MQKKYKKIPKMQKKKTAEKFFQTISFDFSLSLVGYFTDNRFF